MPKENVPCKYLSIIVLDSVIKAKKKYYPQTLLEQCKYEKEKIKMENLTDDDLEKKVCVMSLVMIPMMKENLIMMSLTNNILKKYFNNNKSLIVLLLAFYLRQPV